MWKHKLGLAWFGAADANYNSTGGLIKLFTTAKGES